MLKNLTAIIAGTLITLATGPAFAQGMNVGGAIIDLGDNLTTLQETVDDLQAIVGPKTIFVTNGVFNGDLVQEAINADLGAFGNGLLAADALCQDAADAEGTIVPEASYMALLSASFPDGEGQIRHFLSPSIGPYVRSDGRTVAPNITALLSTGLATPETNLFTSPFLDEFGIVTDVVIWTGSLTTGRSTGDNCTDWTDDTSGVKGSVGANAQVDGGWIDSAFSSNCDINHHLYCVMR